MEPRALTENPGDTDLMYGRRIRTLNMSFSNIILFVSDFSRLKMCIREEKKERENFASAGLLFVILHLP